MKKDPCSSSPSPEANLYAGDCEFTGFLLKKAAQRQAMTQRSDKWKSCLSRAAKVKLLLLDVDGVLTDGSITYTQNGDEVKSFNCRDGFGINILRKAGVEVGIITARKSEALERRARDLSLTMLYQGIRNKASLLQEILTEMELSADQVAYMGDDWLDLCLLTKVGLALGVADATPEVRNVVHYLADNPGGCGAVREVCDLIIEAKGKRQELLNEYLNRQ